MLSPTLKNKRRKRERQGTDSGYGFLSSSERVFLLSRNTRDPTIGSLRDKKESCSTQRGLRVGTGFREFPQTPRGRGFSLHGLYSSFKYHVNVSVG